jgi:hypothetical protein
VERPVRVQAAFAHPGMELTERSPLSGVPLRAAGKPTGMRYPEDPADDPRESADTDEGLPAEEDVDHSQAAPTAEEKSRGPSVGDAFRSGS